MPISFSIHTNLTCPFPSSYIRTWHAHFLLHTYEPYMPISFSIHTNLTCPFPLYIHTNLTCPFPSPYIRTLHAHFLLHTYEPYMPISFSIHTNLTCPFPSPYIYFNTALAKSNKPVLRYSSGQTEWDGLSQNNIPPSLAGIQIWMWDLW